MTSDPADLAKRILRREWEHLTEQERRVIDAILQRVAVSRDATRAFTEGRTLSERLSDTIARFGGSWTFILLFGAFMLVWASLNAGPLGTIGGFDPFPFIFLNLILSTLAALQAPIILMSQNRQAALDRAQAEADYEVNLKAEIEIRHLHEKLDLLERLLNASPPPAVPPR